jgi:hypothetical protein
MSWRFIGRAAELRALEAAYAGSESAFVPVYGRRRVGKSELILQFLRGRPGIYFVGKLAPPGQQIGEFMALAARALAEPLLASSRTADWKTALSEAVARWRRPAKLVLVLDEFQWICQASPELPSVLQELWDRHWQHGGKVMLILCGSYVGFMERAVLGSRQPLFGRRTAQILLRPFGYREAALFHPGYSQEDQARVYFVTGGVPAYLRAFAADKSVAQNIMGALLDELSPLFREAEFLLREELRGLANYQAVLEALAGQRLSQVEIAKATGQDPRAAAYHLGALIGLGYIAKAHPLAGKGPVPARKVQYSLEDALLRFWYRFVFPQQSLIRAAGPERAFKDVIAPSLESYFGACFERLCREALPLIYAREGLRCAFRVGEYWDKRVQLDVVGVREDRWIDLGECRWGPVRSAPALAAELEAKARLFPNPDKATLGQRLFTRRPVAARHTAPREATWFYDLAQLYEL